MKSTIRTLILHVFATTLLCGGTISAVEHSSPNGGVLRAELAGGFVTLNLETGEVAPADEVAPIGEASPDGTRTAQFIRDKSGWSLNVAEIDHEGNRINAERIGPHSLINPADLQWTPDSRRIVFVHGSGSERAAYMIDTQQANARAVRLSENGHLAARPRVSCDGKIAWLMLRKAEGKVTLFDLIVKEGDGVRTIVNETMIMSLEFSPDGSRIAWSDTGTLTIHDLRDGSRRVIHYPAIDERLYNHHASALAWKPDGSAVAARLVFSGGRAYFGDEEPEPMYGDREVFIIDVTGADPKATRVFTLSSDVRGVTWIGNE